MPLKRKNRVITQRVSTLTQDEGSMAIDTQEAAETPKTPKKPPYDSLKDPWTDEQETSLFKGIVRWKPAGMHKHFRMIALSEYLRNHGYDPTVDTHTRIPGIWKKLGSLYNLDTINEGEDSFDYGDDDILEKKYLEFSLPEEEFGKMMWMKGMAPPEALSSPPQLLEPAKKRKWAEIAAAKGRASTVEDTDEAKTSPGRSTTVKAGRSRGGRKAAGRTIEDSTERQASKDTTMDEEEKGENADEDKGEAAAIEDEQVDEDDREESTLSPKVSKIAKAVKGSSQVRAQSKTKKSRRRKQ